MVLRNSQGQFVKFHTTPQEWKKKWSERRTLHPKLNSSRELAYVLGAILGDGNVYKTKGEKGYFGHGSAYRIRLTAKDLDFVEAVNLSICKVISRQNLYKIRKVERQSARGKRIYFELTTFSKAIFVVLKDFNKTREVAELYPADFIRGFADAEGSVSHGRRKNRKPYERAISIANTRLEIIEFIRFLLEKLGIETCFSSFKYSENKECYRLQIYKNKDIIRFYDLIGFNIKRKMEKLLEAIKTIKFFHKQHRLWTEKEIAFLIKNRANITAKEIAKSLKRSKTSVQAMSSTLVKSKLTPRIFRNQHQSWTQEEIKLLLEKGRELTKEELLKVFPNRTWNAIRKKRWRLTK